MSKSPKSKKSAAKVSNAVATVPSVAIAKPVASVPAKPVATERKTIPLTARITVVASENPKRPNTIAASKFPIYFALRDAALKATKGKDGSFSVGDLVKAFAAKSYPARRAFSALRFDSHPKREYIKIAG